MIRLKAFNLLRSVNYNISVNSLMNYIETLGYKTILFNTEKGDLLIKELGIENECLKKDGFVCSSDFKIIFVNAKLKYRSMIITIIHEIAHIVLEHDISLKSDEQQEIEAQMFTNYILTYNKSKIMALSVCIGVAGVMFICNGIRKCIKND